MTDAFEVEIEYSSPDFMDALGDPEGIVPFLADAMENILGAYESLASVYDPESEANRPGRYSVATKEPMGYYERGQGWWYPVMQKKTIGDSGELTGAAFRRHGLDLNLIERVDTFQSIRGKMITSHLQPSFQELSFIKISRTVVAGYKLQATSEQMGKRWVHDVTEDTNGVVGNLINTASYSNYVQGTEQAHLHQARDWKTVMQTWESDALQKVVISQTAKAVKAFYGLR
jgi:hypothetical protein